MTDFDCIAVVPLSSLRLPPGVQLDIYKDPALPTAVYSLDKTIEALWTHLLDVFQADQIAAPWRISEQPPAVQIELVWSGNAFIRTLNRQHRQQDRATDVLTFPLLEKPSQSSGWPEAPWMPLGSIVISVEYAADMLPYATVTQRERFLMERFIHGMLHLLGVHHDTMADYGRVVAVQNRILEAAFP